MQRDGSFSALIKKCKVRQDISGRQPGPGQLYPQIEALALVDHEGRPFGHPKSFDNSETSSLPSSAIKRWQSVCKLEGQWTATL